MSDRKTYCAPSIDHDRATQASRQRQNRAGVILLVVMVLLALMALLGLTLVLVTAQGRLSALAASRRGFQPEHDNQELASVVTQVLTGSTDTNSSFGAHGLLEDLYGLPQFFGRIMPATAGPTVLPIGETVAGANLLPGGNNGTLLMLTVTAAKATGAAGLGPQAAAQFVLPQNAGSFCGQVITMLTGTAAGESARVVGYYFIPNSQVNTPPGTAILQVSSFRGIVPQPGDEFMINGRPFSGTGFGLDLTGFYTATPGLWGPPSLLFPTGDIPLLTALENAANVIPSPSAQASNLPVPSWNMPYAYLPNHARVSLTPWSPTSPSGTYWDMAGPGGANEPYDAPDFQNLMLSMHYWSPFLLPNDIASGNTQGHVVTPIPSLHRPELVGWYYNQSIINPTAFNGTPAMANPALRRKVILRPEPTDNQFQDMGPPFGNMAGPNGIWDAREPYHDVNGNGYYDAGDAYLDGTLAFLDLNGDGAWTAGEPDYSGNTFNPVTGCWYVAANGGWALDTQNPPGYAAPAGVSGNASGLDYDNDGDTIPDSIWVDAGLPPHVEPDGTLTKNLAAILCVDLDGKVNLNAHGTLAQLDVSRYTSTSSLTSPSGPLAGAIPSPNPYGDALFQRNIPAGGGYGPADVNPLHLFVRSHNPVNNGGTAVGATVPLKYYQTLLQGFNYQTFLASYNGYAASGANPPVLQVDGLFGETARLTLPPGSVAGFNFPGVFPPGSYYAGAPPLTYTQQLFNGPRAGWSQWFDPYSTSLLMSAGFTAYWVNDPVALVRFSDIRPGLLIPPSNAAPFFFDFLLGGTATHVPTGHGTPSDLHSRGFLATDLAGRPYYAGTTNLPWQAAPGTWAATMTDLAASEYFSGLGGYAFLNGEIVLNDAVDSKYEMNLTQNARQVGENTGNSVNNIPDFAAIDAKLTPTELEAILRSHEWGSGSTADPSKLQVNRLTNLETAWSYSVTGSTTAKTSTNLGKDNARLALTGESWDLPSPNLALTPRQMQDVVQYVNFMNAQGFTTSFGNSTWLTLNNVSLVELARARVLADNYDPTGPAVTGYITNTSPSMADLSLFGNLKNMQPNVTAFPFNPISTPPVYPVWPLLAPELVLGMRFDVNRTLGNGFDDNGNGVVDEPQEVLWLDAAGVWHTESLTYPFSQINTNTLGPAGQINPVTGMNNMHAYLDLNNDGFYPINPTGMVGFNDPQTNTALPSDGGFTADMRARQLMAKQLYCLMMLLLDDRPYYKTTGGNNTAQQIMAQIFNAAGPMATQYPGGSPDFKSLSMLPREQAAYIIAQWAINVVDFRDRDSIMTPFEFDLYPFRADPYVNVSGNPNLAYVLLVEQNLTWNVDDIIDPFNAASALPWSHQDDTQAYRGLVWGCERPELLLTETVAFHDRGTANTQNAQTLPGGPDTYYQTPPLPNGDTDYDQVRRPRGSLIVELFNPTSYWDAPQRDLQTNNLQNTATPAAQPWTVPDLNTNQGTGVNLAQVAIGQAQNFSGPAASPVWRLVVSYSPWLNESGYYKGWSASPFSGGSTVIDTRAPVLPPTAIHRSVYFTPFQPAFVNGGLPGAGANGAAYGQTATVADALLNASFFADPDIFPGFVPPATLAPPTVPPTILVPPGQYALMGPANQDIAGSGNYYIYAGKNSTTTNTNIYPWLLQLGSLTSAYRTVSWLTAGTAGGGVGQGPYNATLGYGTATSVSAPIKPVIGVPIQTNWFLNNGSQPSYAQHNMNGLAGVSTGNTLTMTTTLRASVSEPEHGYPIFNAVVKDDATYYNSPGSPTSAPFPQHPFDSAQQGQNSNNATLQFADSPNTYTYYTGADTYPISTPYAQGGYTVLYLQRLANPLQVWDAKMNPYITVDSMPVDLTTYTGEPSPNGAPAFGEPTSGGTNPGIGGAASFDTRRRGYDPQNPTNTLLTDQGVPNVWTPLYGGGPKGVPYYPTTNPYAASGSWGNRGLGTVSAPMPVSTVSATGYGSSLGWVNWEYTGALGYYMNNTALTGTSGMPAYFYNGDPKTAFPWLTWNNRPYASQFELMLVPASSPSSQVGDFGMLGWAASGAAFNEYEPYAPVASGGSALTPTAASLPAAQFMQLLNFFNNEQTLSATDTVPTANLLPNLYRIFEFLQVPSRYTGTQDLLNPSQFSGDVGAQVTAIASGGTVTGASHLFHTPFNWLSRYRDPGRINLNTIFDPVVFQSLMDDYPGTLYANAASDLNPALMVHDAMLWPRGLWASMARSRQGFFEDPRRPYLWGATPMPGPYTINYQAPPAVPYAVPNPSAPPNPITQFAYNKTKLLPGINADVPTYFANPFRPDGSAAFVPPADTTLTPPVPLNAYRLMHQWTYPGTPAPAGLNNGVNATLLRSQEATAALPAVIPPWGPTAAVSSSQMPTVLESTGYSSFPMLVTTPTAPTTAAAAPFPAPLAQFDDTAFDLNNPSATYMSGNVTPYRNAGQNAAFQYQMFTKLGNTTTNRSNVYAIWVTLGKFQVQQVGVSPSNPDGYKLVAPVMDSTGSKQAVTRGFYIFDRSIPMGFQRGQDLNVEKGFLVERVLQESN